MSRQINDTFYWRNAEYDLVAQTGGLFSHLDYGIALGEASSTCWAGYHCDFEVTVERGIRLKTLYVDYESNKNTAINGVLPTRRRYGSEDGIYENVDMLLPFTGKLLLGCGPIRFHFDDFYFSSPAWEYCLLYEIEFENGAVTNVKDYNEQTRKFHLAYFTRTEIKRKANDMSVVDECGDIEEKMWWLEYVPSDEEAAEMRKELDRENARKKRREAIESVPLFRFAINTAKAIKSTTIKLSEIIKVYFQVLFAVIKRCFERKKR